MTAHCIGVHAACFLVTVVVGKYAIDIGRLGEAIRIAIVKGTSAPGSTVVGKEAISDHRIAKSGGTVTVVVHSSTQAISIAGRTAVIVCTTHMKAIENGGAVQTLVPNDGKTVVCIARRTDIATQY